MNQFVFKQMKLYYENDSRCKYTTCIEKTLLKFEEGIFDLDLLFGDNPRENIIINVLRTEFLELLENEKNNEIGVFGVRVGYFSDGISWFYEDLFKSNFVKVNPIYASSVDDLKDKVKLNEELWFIFDKQKLLDFRSKHKTKYKKNRKISSKDIDRKIEKYYLNDDFWKVKEREEINFKKWDSLEKELDLSKNNMYENLDKMYK